MFQIGSMWYRGNEAIQTGDSYYDQIIQYPGYGYTKFRVNSI